MSDPKYLVRSVFSTIQGEGPFVGRPAVFVRFGSCNLACPQCDTDFRSGAKLTPLPMLLEAVTTLATAHRTRNALVVLSGGEPLQQPDLWQLVAALDGFQIQVETNGTLGPQWRYARDTSIVCSPKMPKIHPALISLVTAYKYLLDADWVADDGLPLRCFGFPTLESGKDALMGRPARPHTEFMGEVFVQPIDTGDPVKNKLNLDAAIASCMRHGYRLCLQTHKIIGLE